MFKSTKMAALGALTAMLAVPAMASADPPAVGAPTIPPVFVGAPTNDNPNAGQFTVNFASDGTYEGTGIPAEPPLTRDLKPTPAKTYVQARVTPKNAAATATTSERASTDKLFADFATQLRDEANPVASTR